MADKETKPKKNFKLPAIGKPKTKPKKTSVKELGSIANSQFKEGHATKDSRSIVTSAGKKVTPKESAKKMDGLIKSANKGKINPNARWSPSDKSQERTQRKLAKITGV